MDAVDGSAAQAGLRTALADAYDLGGQPGPARRLRAEADVLRRLDG
jgi:hypothetical protein